MNILINMSLFIFALSPVIMNRYPVVYPSLGGSLSYTYVKKPAVRLVSDAPYTLFAWLASHFALTKRPTKPFWVTLLLTILAFRLFDFEAFRHLATRFLALTASKFKMRSDNVRNMFTSILELPQTVNSNHTHGTCAADRTYASMFIDRLAAQLGYSSVFLQMSASDQRRSRDGTRSWFWAKDTSVAPASSEINSNTLVALVDVDQYLDMPNYLTQYNSPVIIYTFQPSEVAKNVPEYSYTFDADNVVNYHVSGGGKYSHQVWNYGHDSLLVRDYLLGVIPWVTMTYSVEKRQTSADHQLILLTPLAKWNFCFAWLANLTLSGPVLKRLEIHIKGFLRMFVQKKEGLFTSTGRPGEYCTATIKSDLDDTIKGLAETSHVTINPAQVRSVNGVAIDNAAATVLTMFHRSKISQTPDYVYPVEHSVLRYQPTIKDDFDPNVKPCLHPFMAPFLYGCYAPDRCFSNDAEAVRARVTSIRSEVVMSPILYKMMTEFVQLLIPVPHMHIPVDYEEVIRRQNRPTQRSWIQQAAYTFDPVRVIKMFMKAESYDATKPARAISTINPTDKVEYSKFVYSFSEYIKELSWYAFGRTPLDTALAVAGICQNATTVVNSDLSRWDGRYSSVLRELEHMMLMRFFAIDTHETLLELHSSQYNLRAFSTFGVKYHTGTSRASGSPETAAFNSTANKFIAYLAYRSQLIVGSSNPMYTPHEAFAKPGIYGGDDGLSADMDLSSYYKACNMVGQQLEAEVIPRGEFGVKFLARVYSPDVWFGSPNSCCDLPRQLVKFHATIALKPSITPCDKLLEKCRAFNLTDANTPVIGRYTSLALKLNVSPVARRDDLVSIEKWGSWYEASVQYPNENSGHWMDMYLNTVLPKLDLDKFYSWLDNVTDLKSMLTPPLLMEPSFAVNKGVNCIVDKRISLGLSQPLKEYDEQLATMRAVYDKVDWKERRYDSLDQIAICHVNSTDVGMFFNNGTMEDFVYKPLPDGERYTFTMNCKEYRFMCISFHKWKGYRLTTGLSIRPEGHFHVGHVAVNHPSGQQNMNFDTTTYRFECNENDSKAVIAFHKNRLFRDSDVKFMGKKKTSKRYDSEGEEDVFPERVNVFKKIVKPEPYSSEGIYLKGNTPTDRLIQGKQSKVDKTKSTPQKPREPKAKPKAEPRAPKIEQKITPKTSSKKKEATPVADTEIKAPIPAPEATVLVDTRPPKKATAKPVAPLVAKAKVSPVKTTAKPVAAKTETAITGKPIDAIQLAKDALKFQNELKSAIGRNKKKEMELLQMENLLKEKISVKLATTGQVPSEEKAVVPLLTTDTTSIASVKETPAGTDGAAGDL